MNQEIHDGEYFIANSVLYPCTAYYYYNDIIKYNYDLEKAREWLSAAGITETFSTEENGGFPILIVVISFLLIPKFISRNKSRKRLCYNL